MLLEAFRFGTAAALAFTLAGCGATDEPEGVRPANSGDEGRPPALRHVDEDDRNSAGGIVAASASPASFNGAGRTPAFGALDTDGDGEISSREIDAAPESLATLDADGDGRLAGDELRPRGGGALGGLALPPGATVAFMPFDAGGDGAPQPPPGFMTLGADGGGVDLADLPPEFQSALSPVDADGDGTASAAELLALMAAGRAGPGGPVAAGTEGPAAMPGRPATAGAGPAADPAAHGRARRRRRRRRLRGGDRIGPAVVARARRRRRRPAHARRVAARAERRSERRRPAGVIVFAVRPRLSADRPGREDRREYPGPATGP